MIITIMLLSTVGVAFLVLSVLPKMPLWVRMVFWGGLALVQIISSRDPWNSFFAAVYTFIVMDELSKR